VSVRLPKGRYLLDSFVVTERGDTAEFSFLVRPSLLVDKATSITVDARVARPVRVTVPRRTARTALVTVGYDVSTDTAGLGSTLLAGSFDGLFTAHQGPPADPDRFVASVNSQWGEPGPDGDFGNTPYIYALPYFQRGRFFTGFRKTAQHRQLATVMARHLATTPDRKGLRFLFGLPAVGFGGAWATGFTHDLPSRVTEYRQPDGVSWLADFAEFTLDPEGFPIPQTFLLSLPTSYQAGRTYRERWNAAVLGPLFSDHPFFRTVYRYGDTVVASIPLFSDADGHLGGSAFDSARTRLFRGGRLVGETQEPGFVVADVPAGPARFRLETTVDRSSVADVSTRLSATWRFRSAHASDEGAALPLSVVRFHPNVDGRNRAARVMWLPVTVQRHPGSSAGRVRSLRVDVSFDDGRTWARTSLVRSGGIWRAKISAPGNARYVSLRAGADDSRGNSVSQVVIRAYGLR